MDFLVICQGLGFALAAGLVIGVVLPSIMPTWGVVAGAAPLGILACAAALSGEGEALWPALPVGLIGAGLAAVVARDIAAGASRRERGTTDAIDAQTPSAIAALFVLAGAVLALLSLFIPPVSLVVLTALLWLWLARRRRAEAKHEGLRVLR